MVHHERRIFLHRSIGRRFQRTVKERKVRTLEKTLSSLDDTGLETKMAERLTAHFKIQEILRHKTKKEKETSR